MPGPDIAFAEIDRDTGERFQPLRRELGVTAFGLNVIVLRPGQRGRIHAHERQEEVYLVLEGELTLLVEGDAHVLGPDRAARVGPCGPPPARQRRRRPRRPRRAGRLRRARRP